jgi:8-oxo-dGTP pyrophosphatase MutT (NUDIX family)
MTIKESSNEPEISAGVIVIREDAKRGPCVLTLSVFGKLDLPKGHLEPEHFTSAQEVDPILLCAADELFQEADYTLVPIGAQLSGDIPVAALITARRFMCRNINRSTGRIRKNVHLYVAHTLCPHAKIKPNPETGIKEHEAVVWVPFDNVSNSKIHEYLKPGVLWAIDRYREFLGS